MGDLQSQISCFVTTAIGEFLLKLLTFELIPHAVKNMKKNKSLFRNLECRNFAWYLSNSIYTHYIEPQIQCDFSLL